jgi:Protein of unknown function (DUF3617)
MGMSKILPVTAIVVALAACGEKPAPVEETAASLSGGLYELTAEVTEVAATEKLPPATKLKLGDKAVIKACVAANGKPAPELFAEEGDSCQFKDSYIRNGRMSAQLSCTRKGIDGIIGPNVDGTFKADSFEGRVTTGTYLYGGGNYRLVRKVTAKRTGDCPPEGAAKTTA